MLVIDPVSIHLHVPIGDFFCDFMKHVMYYYFSQKLRKFIIGYFAVRV